VTDFGLAKCSTPVRSHAHARNLRTPGYIAPEQAKGPAAKLTRRQTLQSRSNFVRSVHRASAFLGEHALAVIQQAAKNRRRNCARSYRRSIATWRQSARVAGARPQARYRSAGDLAVDLERWLEGLPIIARRVSPPVRVWPGEAYPKLAAATPSGWLCMAPVLFLFSQWPGASVKP